MGIFNILKKNLFSVSFENKIMKTISTPIFIKDFNKDSENITQLNQLLNNATDNEMKKKIESEINLQKYVHDSLSKGYFKLKKLFRGLYE